MIAEPVTYINELDADVDVVDEYEDQTLAIPQYSITSYGIDYDVEGLVKRMNNDDILIPAIQREFVWSHAISSRFVESLLLGLPVPGIFLYRMEDDRYQVIDGQQRVKTLQYFYAGEFVDRPFSLVKLESKFNGLMYADLDGRDRRRLNDSIIHATVIRQDKPDDNGSSKFSIFQRLNTNAKPLSSQEIRAAIYQGKFNELLFELNKNDAWRHLFGKKHSRKRDEELILRFLALFYGADQYKAPMKRYLNEFMNEHRNLKGSPAEEFGSVFDRTVQTIADKIGKRAFIPTRAVNAALCDSLMIGIARRLRSGPIESDLEQYYKRLRDNAEFMDLIADTTSAPDRVRQRIQLAVDAFADVG